MQHPSHLYELSLFRQPLQNGRAKNKRTYVGQLVFAGPDAAIEIVGNRISGYVHGNPSHPEGQLTALIARYGEAILKAADDLRKYDTEKVVLTGRWHYVHLEVEPLFEAYLVHLIARNGSRPGTANRNPILRSFFRSSRPNGAR